MKIKFHITSKQQHENVYSIGIVQNTTEGQEYQGVILPKDIWLRARIGDEITLDLSFPHPE